MVLYLNIIYIMLNMLYTYMVKYSKNLNCTTKYRTGSNFDGECPRRLRSSTQTASGNL